MRLQAAGHRALMAGIVAAAASAAPASSFVPWSNPSGSTSALSWSGGGSTDGIWGDPSVNGSTFSFTPDDFRVASNNGIPNWIDGRLEFNVEVAPGRSIAGFAVHEKGYYSILGGGAVKAAGTLIIEDRDTLISYTDALNTTPLFPVITSGSVDGNWVGDMEVIALPPGVTRITIIVDNLLQATSMPGGTSYIDKKTAPGIVEIYVLIPEPASLGLLAGIAPLLLRRRMRSN